MAISRRQKIALASVAIVVVVVLVWKEVFEDRLNPKRWGVVEPGSIYRSGQLHPALVQDTLEKYGIDVVVNMNRLRLDKPAQAAEEVAADALGLEKARYPMGGDGTGDPEMYVLAVEHVYRSVTRGERVLVHCTAGAQRTGAVVALYRTLVQGWSVEDVLNEMEQYDFDRQEDVVLLDFLDKHIAYIAQRLLELGVISSLPDPLPRFRH